MVLRTSILQEVPPVYGFSAVKRDTHEIPNSIDSCEFNRHRFWLNSITSIPTMLEGCQDTK